MIVQRFIDEGGSERLVWEDPRADGGDGRRFRVNSLVEEGESLDLIDEGVRTIGLVEVG